VKDILAGEVEAGYCLKPSQVSKHDLHCVVEAARAKSKRAKQLQVAMTDLTKHDTTLGKDFWTTDLREGLTDALKEEYGDVVRTDLKDSCLNTKLEPAHIRLREDWTGTPPFARFRRMSPQATEVCRRQLQELLEKGMIEPSSSPFGAAVVIIHKPHQLGKFGMVIDYRKLNSITTSDKYPLPDIAETLSDIGNRGYTYWSTFDLCSGFYNIPLYAPHKEYTSMVTPFGSYQWKVMAIGLQRHRQAAGAAADDQGRRGGTHVDTGVAQAVRAPARVQHREVQPDKGPSSGNPEL
jgi:hypothetical protein